MCTYFVNILFEFWAKSTNLNKCVPGVCLSSARVCICEYQPYIFVYDGKTTSLSSVIYHPSCLAHSHSVHIYFMNTHTRTHTNTRTHHECRQPLLQTQSDYQRIILCYILYYPEKALNLFISSQFIYFIVADNQRWLQSLMFMKSGAPTAHSRQRAIMEVFRLFFYLQLLLYVIQCLVERLHLSNESRRVSEMSCVYFVPNRGSFLLVQMYQRIKRGRESTISGIQHLAWNLFFVFSNNMVCSAQAMYVQNEFLN